MTSVCSRCRRRSRRFFREAGRRSATPPRGRVDVATSESRLILRPVPLDPAGFAPYGEVIERRDARLARAINDGTAARLDGLGRVDAELEGAHVGISLVRATPRALPFRLQCVERHLLGTQAFVPLRGSRWLVVVAAAGAALGASDLCAFVAT